MIQEVEGKQREWCNGSRMKKVFQGGRSDQLCQIMCRVKCINYLMYVCGGEGWGWGGGIPPQCSSLKQHTEDQESGSGYAG